MGRVLACDYGRARIGVAYSDERKILATPLGVFSCKGGIDSAIQEIAKAISPLSVFDTLLIGLPLLLSGSEGEMAKEAKVFGVKLSEHLSLPCLFWDERLSSKQADRLMREGNLSRKKRAAHSDTMAAILILQNYLDSLRDSF